jgi:hypothetical protein
MTIQTKLLCAIAASSLAGLVATAPAQALTTQECSAKYQAAKKDGTLGTMPACTPVSTSTMPTRRPTPMAA